TGTAMRSPSGAAHGRDSGWRATDVMKISFHQGQARAGQAARQAEEEDVQRPHDRRRRAVNANAGLAASLVMKKCSTPAPASDPEQRSVQAPHKSHPLCASQCGEPGSTRLSLTLVATATAGAGTHHGHYGGVAIWGVLLLPRAELQHEQRPRPL